jgi:NADH-quinone oxidoreductase subunit M
MLSAGVLMKMGPYGILRFNFGLLPQTTAWGAPALAALGALTVVYAAFCAIAQRDFKRLIAYSTISQMGFCLLAMASLTPTGIEAALVQMFNQGVIAAMLFLLAGGLSDRLSTRDLDRVGELLRAMPVYAAFTAFAFAASLGVPGLSGFVGQTLALVGAFPAYRTLSIMAAFGLILAAVYHLSVLQRIVLDPPLPLASPPESSQSESLDSQTGGAPRGITPHETLALLCFAVLVLFLGVWPRPLLALLDRGASDLSAVVSPAGPARVASARADDISVGRAGTFTTAGAALRSDPLWKN